MPSMVTAIIAAERNWTINYNAGQACDFVIKSVHVYQNCLEQSQKHVCNGTYDHYNYMETRLKTNQQALNCYVTYACWKRG